MLATKGRNENAYEMQHVWEEVFNDFDKKHEHARDCEREDDYSLPTKTTRASSKIRFSDLKPYKFTSRLYLGEVCNFEEIFKII